MAATRTLPLDDSAVLLTDAGLETVLIFHHGLELPCFAAFPLLEHEDGRTALEAYFASFLELARRHDAGFVLDTATWRANPDWGAQLGYDGPALAEVNRRSVAFMEGVRASAGDWGRPLLIQAVVGPRADGYASGSAMSSAEAAAYHAPQLRTLADTAVDLAGALTLTYAEEAIGIARAARGVGLPVAVSFTVETDGRLPTGQSLRAAIEQVDAETDGAPAYYMVNCAHPTHVEGALADDGPWRERLRGLRANASPLSHAELDESDDLDDGDPADLGARYATLRAELPGLTILGGCCGTDIRHVTAICEACLPA